MRPSGPFRAAMIWASAFAGFSTVPPYRWISSRARSKYRVSVSRTSSESRSSAYGVKLLISEYEQVEQQALEVGRDLDVHRRREARVHLVDPVLTRREEPVENVVLVRGHPK